MKCPKCGTDGMEKGVCFYCKGVEDMKKEKEQKKKKRKTGDEGGNPRK